MRSTGALGQPSRRLVLAGLQCGWAHSLPGARGGTGKAGVQGKGRVDGKGSAYVEMAALDRNVSVPHFMSSACAQSLWRATTILEPFFLLLYPSASKLGMGQGSPSTFPGSQRSVYPVKRI